MKLAEDTYPLCQKGNDLTAAQPAAELADMSTKVLLKNPKLQSFKDCSTYTDLTLEAEASVCFFIKVLKLWTLALGEVPGKEYKPTFATLVSIINSSLGHPFLYSKASKE